MRRQRTTKQAPFGRPKSIILLVTPDGWRYSVATEDGGSLCGRLADVIPALDTRSRTGQVTLAAAPAELTEPVTPPHHKGRMCQPLVEQRTTRL
jgi:hypothetical protein